MQVVETSLIYATASDVFTLWDIVDIHYGSRYCAEELFESVIQKIRDNPMARWWGGGDLCDHILYHDEKRFDPEGVAR